ncbi:unnamed protein product [Brachionus calyciflorus]|uniref:Uncharacterized protein n=1 Tax=Brachionus calyciflorus TaxID=104777 RepID=A0A813WPJ8_9BILA|nr:unnamed protein product [Brachionus calyciflorus]
MTIRYRVCSSKICRPSVDNEPCFIRYKILSCSLKKIFKLFLTATHLADIKNLDDQTDKRFGILSPIKNIIKYEIKNRDAGPINIQTFLIVNRATIQEENPILQNFEIPSIEQIQNLKANFKKEIGKNNCIKL